MSSRPLPRGGLGDVAFLGATGETDGTLPSTRARNLAGYPFSCAKSGYNNRCVWARPCPLFATVTLPVSEAPNWLGAGTPSAPGVTVAHPSAKGKGGKMHTGRVLPMATAWAGGAPAGSWSTRAPIVVQGACRPGCGVGGWVLQDVAVTRPGWPHGRVLGGAARAHAARPQISASNADSSPTSRSFCSRFCRMRSRCAVVTLK